MNVFPPMPPVERPPTPGEFANQDEDFMNHLVQIMEQIYAIAFGWGANVDW